MTKSELIEKIAAKNPNLMVKDVEKIVNVILNKIISTLANGDRVEFRGFGTFAVHVRAPRVAKNPRTGEQIKIGERKITHFKVGKELHKMLNQ